MLPLTLAPSKSHSCTHLHPPFVGVVLLVEDKFETGLWQRELLLQIMAVLLPWTTLLQTNNLIAFIGLILKCTCTIWLYQIITEIELTIV